PRKIDMEARLPASVNGNVKLSAKGDFISDKISFDADLTAEEISLPYFMPFYINTAPVIVNSGRADLRSIAKCRNNQLYAVQKVDIEDLEITVNEVNAGDSKVFGLPIANVANFFVNTDGRLSFEFEITGTLSDPEFHIGEALKKVLINSIGEALLNRLSNIPGQILGTVQESGQIGQAGKEVLEDIFQKILKPRN
ncbi:MAG: DUF748 domain-containing protein, partial [Candidatus Omnitrophica bacterium]|nr:DUF748 domain-containing protein [Candidatus Omnitrophota bacterium]